MIYTNRMSGRDYLFVSTQEINNKAVTVLEDTITREIHRVGLSDLNLHFFKK